MQLQYCQLILFLLTWLRSDYSARWATSNLNFWLKCIKFLNLYTVNRGDFERRDDFEHFWLIAKVLVFYDEYSSSYWAKTHLLMFHLIFGKELYFLKINPFNAGNHTKLWAINPRFWDQSLLAFTWYVHDVTLNQPSPSLKSICSLHARNTFTSQSIRLHDSNFLCGPAL